MNPPILTPAVRQALAYVAILGQFPKGIHRNTRITASDRVRSTDATKTNRFYDVSDEADYAGTALWKAHAALLRAGFCCRGNLRVRSDKIHIYKTIRYEKIDRSQNGFSATVYPDGRLYLNRVDDGYDNHRKGNTVFVSAANAGTLPALFTASP